jgi:hypothetical protein
MADGLGPHPGHPEGGCLIMGTYLAIGTFFALGFFAGITATLYMQGKGRI